MPVRFGLHLRCLPYDLDLDTLDSYRSNLGARCGEENVDSKMGFATRGRARVAVHRAAVRGDGRHPTPGGGA
jgi:hypothetical protein